MFVVLAYNEYVYSPEKAAYRSYNTVYKTDRGQD